VTPAPRRPYTPPPAATEFLVKETRLANGAVAVRADIPLAPAGPKPAVIALVGDTHQLVGAGFVSVTYSINWNLLKGPQPPAPPAEQTVGKWVLASRSASTLGETYLHEIATTANTYVPMVLDWIQTLPEVDRRRIGMGRRFPRDVSGASDPLSRTQPLRKRPATNRLPGCCSRARSTT